MKKDKDKNLTPIFAFLCLVFFCGIVVYFRVFSIEDLPASFVGAALGAIITGVVTTILLKAQSQALEIKDRNAKVFEQKSAIFQKYIKNVWRIWDKHKVTAETFQKLTSDYYSELMIYLPDDSINKISDYLSKIGNCIDMEDSNHDILRDNVIGIINTLSEGIELGGHIDPVKVKELDTKVFPVLFKKTLVSEIKKKMMEEKGLFDDNPKLIRAYSKNNEYLQFVFKEHPDCKVSIGPFNVVSPIKMGLDINKKLHEFDEYRWPNKKYGYWIVTRRNDTKEELLLNEKLPHDEEADDIESGNMGKIKDFGFNDTSSIEQFEGNYQTLSALLAQRAAYYLKAETINNKFTIAEFPESILKGKNIVDNNKN